MDSFSEHLCNKNTHRFESHYMRLWDSLTVI